MRQVSFFLGVAMLVVSVPACGGLPAGLQGKSGPPAVVIPDFEEVAQARVEIEGGPAAGKRYPGAPFELVLKEGPDVKPILDWLRSVDWTQEGADVATMDLAPDGSIELTLRDETTLRFLITQGGIIYDNRLRNADTDRLEKIVNRLSKKG